MSFTWSPHRFAGGALALDVANSIILRVDPLRRLDRWTDVDEVARFAQAAGTLSMEQAAPGPFQPVPTGKMGSLLALREAIDRHFRALVIHDGRADNQALADLLMAIAGILQDHPGQHVPGDGLPLDLATATSALALLSGDNQARMKICRHCGWLFIDRSKNKSRIWCDMRVCGNRKKAQTFYRKGREIEA